MSRATLAVDRVMAAVLGLVLIAAAVIGILWWSGRLASQPDTVRLSSITWLPGLSGQSWWPWALGAVGLVLTLLGVRWLFGHIPQRGVSRLNLPGSDGTGTLYVDAKPVAAAAAETLTASPGVRSAHGIIRRERGQITARIDATIDPATDLHAVAAAADAVSADLKAALARDDLTCQVLLRSARREHPTRHLR